jgi:DNA-binding transcriptional regulator PaaX
MGNDDPTTALKTQIEAQRRAEELQAAVAEARAAERDVHLATETGDMGEITAAYRRLSRAETKLVQLENGNG